MSFSLPVYRHPDLNKPPYMKAPVVKFERAEKAGVAPENYHATSIYPEYFQVRQRVWELPRESRMDCVAVLTENGALEVKEFRNIQAGDLVVCGRHENGEDGIVVHTEAFDFMDQSSEKFAFRSRITRETAFSIDYDMLYDLLEFEREMGFIVWVLGPAVVFDKDARSAFTDLVNRGFVHALLAGNALATHDVEAALYSTGLGQDIYSKKTVPLGHYNHLDAINTIRRIGSLGKAIGQGTIKDGVMRSVIMKGLPFVLSSSIRDDGPLPEVVADAYTAQDCMRSITRKATTVIAMATQLHAIATGNMVPSYRVLDDGTVRPVYFYTVDMSEFAVNKLANRGSLTARAILTNVQDFVVTVERELRKRER
jgi:lysine-ketoglutarate reductase/saccharopine dehydrogenase-like protein (TIGR00300 family)